MNENEIMNTEAIDTTDVVELTNTVGEVANKAGVDGRDFIGIAIGMGIAVGAQFVYKRVIKPGIAKFKAKKEASAEKVVNISEDYLDVDDVNAN